MTTPTAAGGGVPAAQPNPADWRWYGSRLAAAGYGLVCLQILVFGILAMADPAAYNALTKEDNWVEYLTAAWYLLAGAMLFAAAWLGESRLARSVFILAGLAMVFAAGEEISWGQRIIGFATPDNLLAINVRDEFNVHNIYTKYTGDVTDIYNKLPLVLCITAMAALFCGKDRLYGIPTPSFLMILSIIVIEVYDYQLKLKDLPTFVLYQTIILLPLLACYAVISGRAKLLPAIVSAVAIVAGNIFTMRQTYLALHSPVEFKEYLIGIICVWYALELLLAQKRWAGFGRLAGFGERARTGLAWSRPVGISAPRLGLAVCVLAIAAGIGLAFFSQFNSTRRSVYFAETYSAPVAAAVPVASSYFNIFSNDGRLYYFRDNCTAEDTADHFFLHIYPTDSGDLPSDRRQRGFQNLDFRLSTNGMMVDGQCATYAILPRYPIALVRTGQYILDGPRLWEVEFALPAPP